MYAQALTVTQDSQDDQDSCGTVQAKKARKSSTSMDSATAAPWLSVGQLARSPATSTTVASAEASAKPKRKREPSNGDGKERVAVVPLQAATASLPAQRANAAAAAAPCSISTNGTTSTAATAITAQDDTWSLESWNNCQTFTVASVEEKFQPPQSLTKETQKAKWKAELGKVRPFLEMMERFLCADGSFSAGSAGRVKESELKAAFKAFKVNPTKLDRKLEYTAEVGEEKLFSGRLVLLKDILQGAKDLKETALCCGKSGTCSTDGLKNIIDQIHTHTEYFMQENWLSFPVHWVQARTVVITFHFSYSCFCFRGWTGGHCYMGDLD